MPNKCVAFGCETGYAKQDGGSDDNNIKPTLHSFPKDKVVFDKWIKALSRKDFIPSRNSRVCSKHFLPSDFVEVSQDSNIYRTKKQTERKLNLRYLKDDAVPSIFDNVPSYMTGNEVSRRTTTMATASTRSWWVGIAQCIVQSWRWRFFNNVANWTTAFIRKYAT